MDAPALRELVGRWPLDDGQPIYALDTSVWPRDDAETSPGRGYYYSASRQSAGQPIVAGWSYGWLAQVSFTHDSWTAPLDVRRVPPTRRRARRRRRADPGRCSGACRPTARSRCSCSTPATIPRSWPASWATWMASGSRCWCGCGAGAASMPIPTSSRAPGDRAGMGGSSPAPTRATWWAPTSGAPRGACPVRGGAGARLGRCAREDAEPSEPGQSASQAHRPRHPGAGRGRAAAAPDAHPQAALAVVARPGHARPGRALAGVRPPLRSGAHLPLLQADAQLDHAPRPPPRAGRSLDLAGRCWPTPSSAWPAAPSRTGTCPGSAPSVPTRRASHPPACVRRFRSFWSPSTRPPTRQNPADAHRGARSDVGPAQLHATRPSKRPPDSSTGSLPITKPAESRRRAGAAAG